MFKNEIAPSSRSRARDPLALLRQMASEFDSVFDDPFWPRLRARGAAEGSGWLPGVDVFERDNRLVTRVDLPGMRKEDVNVEVTDGHLTISGERKSETEEKNEQFYRRERETGRFYRAVPLPEGVKVDDVKATFADGVLEVSVPLPASPAPTVRKVEIRETSKPASPSA